MRDVMLVIHFIGLAMGIGTSFAFMFLGMAGSKMNKEDGMKFMLNTLTISRMGQIGFVLLFLSGGYLMTPHWSSLTSMPLLMTKLILFLVLGALLGIIGSNARKAKQGDAEKYLGKIKPLGMLTMLVGLTIVLLAVFVFH